MKQRERDAEADAREAARPLTHAVSVRGREAKPPPGAPPPLDPEPDPTWGAALVAAFDRVRDNLPVAALGAVAGLTVGLLIG